MKIISTGAINFGRNNRYKEDNNLHTDILDSCNKDTPYRSVELSDSRIGKAMKNITLFTLPASLPCVAYAEVQPKETTQSTNEKNNINREDAGNVGVMVAMAVAIFLMALAASNSD